MKKSLLTLSAVALLSIGAFRLASAQEQPKPQKDTVNMDTYAKPEKYYDIEDDKQGGKSGSGTVIAIVAGAVIVVGVAGFLLFRKKKS